MKKLIFIFVLCIILNQSYSDTVSIKVKDLADFYKHISKGDYDELVLPDGMIISDSFNIFNPVKDHKIIGEGDVRIKSMNAKDWEAIEMDRDNRNWTNIEPNIIFENIKFEIIYKVEIFLIERNLNVKFINCDFTGFFHSEEMMRNNGSSIVFENCRFKSFNYIVFNKFSENKHIIFKDCTFEKVGCLVENLEDRVNINIENITYKGKSNLPLLIMTSGLEDGFFVKFDRQSIQNMEDSQNMLVLFPIKGENGAEEDVLYFYEFNKKFWEVMDQFMLDFYIDINLLSMLKDTDYNYSKFSKYMRDQFEQIRKSDIDREQIRTILNFRVFSEIFKILMVSDYIKPEDKLNSFDLRNVMNKIFKDKYHSVFFPYFNTLAKYKTKTAASLLSLRKELFIDGQNSAKIENMKTEEFLEIVDFNLNDLKKMKEDEMFFDSVLKNEVPVYLTRYFSDDRIFTKKVKKNIEDIKKLSKSSEELTNMICVDFPVSILMANLWLKGQNADTKENIIDLAKILSQTADNIKDKLSMPAVDEIIKKTAAMLKKKYEDLN